MSTTRYTDKNPINVAGGLKAAIHNPNVSEEAKERAAERLHEMGADNQNQSTPQNLTGYSDSESITQQDIAYAREILEAVGYSIEKPAESTHDEHQTRVLAGYKAALSNPHVSKEAKAHAQAYLNKHRAA
ncbi:hypothetical protein PLEOSDRAFT_1085281 [Pleurotus ostreatus PC15]|uniref:Conidiation-specific protein 6 n=1 Tax=Pleurotus ostreatus (strain PC15) TaxID=1137138 RepID=A0A067NG66_PLEO1|nr:hypothetical protein PLEOSDRAFT_1085281 [Pleurotus ostreatus PC15]